MAARPTRRPPGGARLAKGSARLAHGASELPRAPILTDVEFDLLSELIYEKAGIHLSASKKSLLFGRLAGRIRELGLASFREYHHHVTRERPDEMEELLNRICTNETQFFREPQQFEFLKTRVCGEWEAAAEAGTRRRSVRVWSAACSTGEEPFSLAMTLLRRLRPEKGWGIDILATDLSTRALYRAASAVWPIARAAQIQEEDLKAFMLQGTGPQEGSMKAGPEVRALVRFEQFNLIGDSVAPGGPFDLILCRNVLIYFDKETRVRVLQRLLAQLSPGGYLFLGHAESLAALPGAARAVGPAMYRFLGSGLEVPSS
jgi:chemotaxis protein methyltransferase CheR